MTSPLSIHAPAGVPRGGIVVLQEAFGVNDHIEDVCRKIAAEGYLAVAPHLFHRTGDPKLGYTDFDQVYEHMGALTHDQVLEDVDAALEHLSAAGVGLTATGVVGFCLGGSIALGVAARRDIGAAVTYYGGGIVEGRFGFPPLLESASQIRAPWLGLFGDLDASIPVSDVEALREVAARSEHETEVVRFADAEHGFNCDRRPSYHPDSATAAWQLMLGWFDRLS